MEQGSKNYIAYYRVSTRKQGESKLGLEAQEASVTKYIKRNDGNVIASYTDIDTGKNDKRIELVKALAHARKTKATLIVAKLDRLSRSAAFIFQLTESKLPFIISDMPEINELTIHILAVMAQHELKLIRERTKAAIQARKDRGLPTGNAHNMTNAGRLIGAANHRKISQENDINRRAYAFAMSLRKNGSSITDICVSLNDNGFVTPRKCSFSRTSVARLLRKYDKV